MKVISVNVGRPREVRSGPRVVLTSIFKSPIEGSVTVRRLNVDGDQQSDLTVHGGPDKAVYAYPSEHYEFWRQELPETNLPWGVFGENLTIEGLLETTTWIGDRVRIGEVELAVTQPRMPCFKLGIRFNREDMVKRFLQSRRSGFYLRVLREGTIAAGDSIVMMPRDHDSMAVADMVGLYTAGDDVSQALLQRAIGLPGLSAAWREHFRARLRPERSE